MVLFLYSNDKVEHQAIACLKSLESKITDDVQIVYYTVGFMSSFTCKNLHKVSIDYMDYPAYPFYKAALSLRTMEMFPDEEHFIFTDTDVLFSHRFDFDKLKFNEPHPRASYGPHEYTFTYAIDEKGNRIEYNEADLMRYFNVPKRTCRYVWTCFYTFNRNCKDFLQEWLSILGNKYLQKNRHKYFPFQDETAFNICLWKRNATDMLGFAFLNTHNPDIIKQTETTNLSETYGGNYDQLGLNWEYVKNSEDIILYHGMKEISDIQKCMNVLNI